MTADRNELARRIYAGERELLPLLYELCSGIINKQAFSFYRAKESRCLAAGVTVEDLISVGYFALLEAVKAYNKDTKGYNFLAYLRYPLLNQFNTAIGYRTTRTAREPLNNAVSLNAPPRADIEDVTLLDIIEDKEGSGVYDDVVDSVALAEVFPEVKRVLQDHPKRYDVLVKAYKENKTVKQIAEELGMTVGLVNYNRAEARRRLWRSQKLKHIYVDVIGGQFAHSSLGYWKNTHNSAVEWAAMKRERLRREEMLKYYRKQRG